MTALRVTEKSMPERLPALSCEASLVASRLKQPFAFRPAIDVMTGWRHNVSCIEGAIMAIPAKGPLSVSTLTWVRSQERAQLNCEDGGI
jgi:hypothetical protein